MHFGKGRESRIKKDMMKRLENQSLYGLPERNANKKQTNKETKNNTHTAVLCCFLVARDPLYSRYIYDIYVRKKKKEEEKK